MNQPEAIAACTTRIVKAGCEQTFEQELHKFIQNSFNEPGQLGVYVLRPPPGVNSREYGIVRRFADSAARDVFYSSKVFRDWQQKVAPLTERKPIHENISGLETWFTLPGQREIVPPPRWKMAIMTFLGVYPVTSILGASIMPLMFSWHPLLSNLVFSGLVVILLTWIVMPLLTRLFTNWLFIETNN